MPLDPEIVSGFQEESQSILKELTQVVEQLEESEEVSLSVKLLADFAQKIDRIMGACDTLAMEDPGNLILKQVGALARVCKNMGYRASQHPEDQHLLPVFAAFWADTIEVIESLVTNLAQPEKASQVIQKFAPVVQKRLEWLHSKVKDAPAYGLGQLLDSLKG